MEKRKATIIFDDEDVQAPSQKEHTKTLRISESYYDLVNLIAFKTGKTKNYVADRIIEVGIKELKLREKFKNSLIVILLLGGENMIDLLVYSGIIILALLMVLIPSALVDLASALIERKKGTNLLQKANSNRFKNI